MAYNSNNQRRGTLLTALVSMVTMFSLSRSGEIPVGTVANFNLTDCPDGWVPFTEAHGRFIMEAGKYGNMTYQLGDSGGEAEHTLTMGEMPSHAHGVDDYMILSQPCNGAGCTDSYTYHGGSTDQQIVGSIQSQGNSESHNNIPPYYVLTACQKINNPHETIGIRTENPNPKNALDVNGSVAINGSINIARNGNVTSDILCALNKQCVPVSNIATKEDLNNCTCSESASNNNTTTNASIVLSAVSIGIAAISSFFVCKQSKRIRDLEQQVNNGAVQLNVNEGGPYQSALINH